MSTSTSPLSSISSSVSATENGTGTFNAQAYVQSILQSEEGPEELMQQQVATLSNQATDLGTISTQLGSLQTAVLALNDFNGALDANQASSSDSSVATATADSTAGVGSHTLTVSNLASTSSQYSTTYASGDAAIPTGSFDIQVGSGTPTAITVDSSDDTLNGLASAINSASAGVTASVITDASGARLSLESGTSGAPGEITISNDTLSGFNFTQAVAGENASFTLDGIALTSTSNTVTGVLQGVTLDLQGASSGAGATISISPDTTQATTAIQNFVTAYNTVMQTLNGEFSYNASTQSLGPLGSDQTVMQVQQSLLSDASFSLSGNSGLTNLAAIGISMNQDGTLSISSSTLQAAMASNYSAVQNLFQQASPAGFAQSFNNDLMNITDPGTGPIALDQQGVQQETTSLNQQITEFQNNLNQQETQLMQTYAQVAATLQDMPTLLSQTQSELSNL
ncbi:MAG: flagellar filament capping protein FliD [Terriglobales bacterium]